MGFNSGFKGLTSRPVLECSLLSSRGFIHQGKASGAWVRLHFPPFRPSSRKPGTSPPFPLFAFSWHVQESNKLKFSRTSAFFWNYACIPFLSHCGFRSHCLEFVHFLYSSQFMCSSTFRCQISWNYVPLYCHQSLLSLKS